jgi:hypothetical protein
METASVVDWPAVGVREQMEGFNEGMRVPAIALRQRQRESGVQCGWQ